MILFIALNLFKVTTPFLAKLRPFFILWICKNVCFQPCTCACHKYQGRIQNLQIDPSHPKPFSQGTFLWLVRFGNLFFRTCSNMIGSKFLELGPSMQIPSPHTLWETMVCQSRTRVYKSAGALGNRNERCVMGGLSVMFLYPNCTSRILNMLKGPLWRRYLVT